MDDLTKATIARRQQAAKSKRRKTNKGKNKMMMRRKNTTLQTSIEQYIRKRYLNDGGTGHIITTALEGTNIRLLMQNPRGVMKTNPENGRKRDGQLDLTYLFEMRDLEVDVLGLPETNLNWRNQYIRARWERVVKDVWPKSRIFYSSINVGENENVHKQGGVCTIVTEKWAPFVESVRQDNVGRWVEITMKGQKDQRVTIITAYRPGDGCKTSGCGTVWRQQFDYYK